MASLELQPTQWVHGLSTTYTKVRQAIKQPSTEQRAACLIESKLSEEPAFRRHLEEPIECILSKDDITFLKSFLACKQFYDSLKLIDLISQMTQRSTKLATNLQPRASSIRPQRQCERNYLLALTESWQEIENLLHKCRDKPNEEAEKLYRILSDEFIRELLVAADDIANLRYTAFVDHKAIESPLYLEREPICTCDGYVVLGSDSMNQPLSDAFPPQQLNELISVAIPKKPQDLISKVTSEDDQNPSSSVNWHLPHPPPRSSSMAPRRRKPSLEELSPGIAPSNNHVVKSRSLGRARLHSALPSYIESSLPEPGQLRTITVNRRNPGEPLGITLATATVQQNPGRTGSFLSLLAKHTAKEERNEPQSVVIQRVIVGSLADREGKLFPGDEILKFNGVDATSLEVVQKAMMAASPADVIQLVVKTPGMGQLKSHLLSRNRPEHKVYIRCLFKYDPTKDTLIPNTDLGVAFKSGDVLELVDAQDLNWWQVRRLDTPNSPVGLVPSQTLEERRQAFNQQASRLETHRRGKKVRSLFRAADSSNLLVRSDLWVYEEVIPWPPSPVHTLLLIGPNGVGRRTLKFLLCTQLSQKFAFPMSETTDPKAVPTLFRVRSREDMESDIRQGAYVEWGTVDGHHYGISFASIREIISTGRTALIDCQCQSVHLLHQPEFNPHVVFVSAPNFDKAKAMMEIGIREGLTMNSRSDEEIREIVDESKVFAIRNQHLYTHTLVNSNMAESVEKLHRLVTRLEHQPGWIPAGWAYEMSLPKTLEKDGKPFYHLPGLSVISGSSIPGLPVDSQSVLGRVTNSVVSTPSPESAVRLARPPSVCSSLQLAEVANHKGYPAFNKKPPDSSPNGTASRWRYEKRGHPQRPETPLSSVTGSEADNSQATSVQFESRTAETQLGVRPAQRGPRAAEKVEPNDPRIAPPNAGKQTGPMKSNVRIHTDVKNVPDVGEISSTSSEED